MAQILKIFLSVPVGTIGKLNWVLGDILDGELPLRK